MQFLRHWGLASPVRKERQTPMMLLFPYGSSGWRPSRPSLMTTPMGKVTRDRHPTRTARRIHPVSLRATASIPTVPTDRYRTRARVRGRLRIRWRLPRGASAVFALPLAVTGEEAISLTRTPEGTPRAGCRRALLLNRDRRGRRPSRGLHGGTAAHVHCPPCAALRCAPGRPPAGRWGARLGAVLVIEAVLEGDRGTHSLRSAWNPTPRSPSPGPYHG